MMKFLQAGAALTIIALALGGCSVVQNSWHAVNPVQDEGTYPTTAAGARAFLADYDRDIRKIATEAYKAAWLQATYITPDSQLIAAKAYERLLAWNAEQAIAARQFDGLKLDASVRRQLELLRLSNGVPTDPEALAELTTLGSELEAAYGSGRYCPQGPDSCKQLGALEKVLATSRNPDDMLEAWAGWRSISPPMRDNYIRFVELQNSGARELGFADAGEYWRAQYDMAPDAFSAEVERLWEQVSPLYEALHCEVRAQLNNEYGDAVVTEDGPIPAHVLGNMWSQQWGNIYPLVVPFPDAPATDVTAALEAQQYTAERMVRQAEGFYTDLGMPSLPPSFYERSMLTKPRDRDVVCHASAWDLDFSGDVRIKMCIQPDSDNLTTIYHELGHIYYDLAYNPLPVIFQNGAHDGFHEAIGDTMVLAMTPDYLASVGLAQTADNSSEQAVINAQMQMALDKIAFLPFGLLVDQWRWKVFSGEVNPQDYNAAWWELRERYQGIQAPVDRTEADFDPGAKYHIPGNTPYMRYFLAHILQFQFYQAMCDAAGHEGTLHSCSFAGSEEAGDKMWALLSAGQSKPWPETLELLTGSPEMDASAVIDYFQPLMAWLAQRNEDRSCGW
jgi:peptidyl-dipeptidase A